MEGIRRVRRIRRGALIRSGEEGKREGRREDGREFDILVQVVAWCA